MIGFAFRVLAHDFGAFCLHHHEALTTRVCFTAYPDFGVVLSDTETIDIELNELIDMASATMHEMRPVHSKQVKSRTTR